MAIERYKLFYQNSSLVRIVEVADGSGVLYENPITYTQNSTNWGSLISGIVSCSDSNIDIIQSCLFDNTTGDYLNMVPFVRYSTIDTVTGELTYLGDYQFVSSGVIPYTLIGAPIQQAGPDVKATKPFRQVLSGGGSWVLSTYPKTIAVLLNVVSGVPTMQDANGTTTLYQNESISFVSAADGAGLLTGDLTIAATTGDLVTISWVELST